MKRQVLQTLSLAGALSVALFVHPAAAQDAAKPTAPSVTNATAPEKSAPVPAIPPGGAADVLKLLDAGVSADVVKTYIQTSSTGWNLSAADIVALKNHGVSDDLTLELLKHRQTAAPDSPPPLAPPPAGASAPVRTVTVVRSSRLDPESYEFFQHYYLFPRTLAYVNQTLGYSPAPFGYGGGPYYPYGGYHHQRRYFAPNLGYQSYPGP